MLNSVTAFLDEHIALDAADRPAIVSPAGANTSGTLLDRVNRTGHALRSLGVEPGQRVAMLLADGVTWAATFSGALRIGAVAVPLTTRLRPTEWVAMIRDSSAKVLGYRSLDEMLATAPAERVHTP